MQTDRPIYCSGHQCILFATGFRIDDELKIDFKIWISEYGLKDFELVEQILEWQKVKRSLVNFNGFAQIEVNDIGLIRVVPVNETA
jgi:hypothetical protein